MRKIFMIVIIIAIIAISCDNKTGKDNNFTEVSDSLQKKSADTYTPGLGEFMTSIQTHHAKLWFAGINKNWPLAEFEIGEIEEILEDIRHFNSERTEVKSLPMIQPAIDSVSSAVTNKNPDAFKSAFTLLTATCNNCHKTTDHAFNVVTIPTAPPVTNQDFKPAQ